MGGRSGPPPETETQKQERLRKRADRATDKRNVSTSAQAYDTGSKSALTISGGSSGGGGGGSYATSGKSVGINIP